MTEVQDRIYRLGIVTVVLTLVTGVIRIWTVIMAFTQKGWLSALLALVLFLYAEALWSYRLWSEAPVYAWTTSVWLVLYIGVMSWAWFLKRRHPMAFEEDDEATS